MEEKELSEEELENVLGGIPYDAAIEKVYRNSNHQHENMDIQKQIEELTRQRDALLSSKEYQEALANTQSGKSK